MATESSGQQPDAGDSGVVPLHRSRREVVRHVEVERIDTEPMTDGQYQAAVAALAALITHWQQHGSPPSEEAA
jgi:hypothetical protein